MGLDNLSATLVPTMSFFFAFPHTIRGIRNPPQGQIPSNERLEKSLKEMKKTR